MTEIDKHDWRDSNWYIGITSFWREFRRHKIGLLGVLVLSLFIAMAITAPLLATHDPSPNNKVAPSFLAPGWMSVFDPDGVVTQQILTDSNFTNLPDYERMGDTPSQFSLAHSDGSDGSDSHVNLTWSYIAGSPLNFTEDPENHLPDTADFIYFTQTFDWPYDRLPSDVNITLDLATTLTGDFADNEEGGLMFKVYLWLIDSSGNWQRIYRSFPPYAEIFQQRRIDLNYFDIAAGWRGMVEDEDGVQEDPLDELTIAIGLAPTSNFESFLGTNPWLEYSGDVTVSFR
ncbi:MAG: hypothetical protein ACTSU3_02495, partial [Candidatus Thorarchaeota archaeon]